MGTTGGRNTFERGADQRSRRRWELLAEDGLVWYKEVIMRSRLWLPIVALMVLTAFPCTIRAQAREPKKEATQIKENAYYEFRGHVTDRNTIENTFTLEWSKGSQIIMISSATKIFRHGQVAKLESVKAGDAARGFGQAMKGKLVASAVAFGAEGVELPSSVKVPTSITLPPSGQ